MAGPGSLPRLRWRCTGTTVTGCGGATRLLRHAGRAFGVPSVRVMVRDSVLISNDFAVGSECSGGCSDITLRDTVMSDANGSAINVLRLKRLVEAHARLSLYGGWLWPLCALDRAHSRASVRGASVWPSSRNQARCLSRHSLCILP